MYRDTFTGPITCVKTRILLAMNHHNIYFQAKSLRNQYIIVLWWKCLFLRPKSLFLKHTCLSQKVSFYIFRVYAWLRGCVAAWLRGCVAAWLRGCVAAWLRGCVAAWLRGCVAAWLRGCVAAWLCVCVLCMFLYIHRYN